MVTEWLPTANLGGPGWQTRINEVLLKSVRAKRAGAR
jgi:uncharacterized protein (DUF4415 family)